MGMIDKIISHIGDTAEALIDEGLIDGKKLEYMFAGDTTFFTKPEKGLRLVFDAATRILNSVQFSLIDTMADSSMYRGQMPTPFTHSLNKTQIRTLLGEPNQVSEAKKYP